ncbi:MAG: two-partner secretion domain-containing protein [Phycisphaerales bacterium]
MMQQRPFVPITSPLVLALLAGTAMGGPEGERVVAGEAAIARDGARTTITAADNTIIEFRSFDIRANEAVQFIQPSTEARVLNRVLGASPTRIDGSLTANGRVYLVNEAGVYFGATSVVSAGAIYAAAGTMTNADFLGGVDRFGTLAGEVELAGRVAASEIHVAGRRVTNLGDLDAQGGLVTLSSGDEVLLGRRDGHVFVRISDGTNAGSTGVDQAGRINASGGQVRIGAGDMYSIALRPTSQIAGADVRVESAGRGTVRVEGEIDASSGTADGGFIGVTGEGVAVVGAELNASGAGSGGTILVGGGFRGDTSDIATATGVFVAEDTAMIADAGVAGDGGLIVTWADNATVFRGKASARGGAERGDGGLIEVSSPRTLAFEGRADTSAANGERGTLLLDPDRINIVGGSGQSSDSLLDDNQIPVTEAPGISIVISEAALEAIGDTNVLLEATSEIIINSLEDGSLDFAAGDGATVTFNAGNDFFVNGDVAITTQGAGLTITANDSIVTGSLRTLGGDISLTTGDRLETSRLVETTGNAVYTLTNPGGTATIGGLEAGSISVNADRVELRGNLISGSDFTLAGFPELVLDGPETVATIGAFSGTDTFDLTIDPSVSIIGGGALRFVGRRVELPTISNLSGLEVTATQELVLNGDIRLDNSLGGRGGLADLREAAAITLTRDTVIDTDIVGDDARAGDILLDGARIDGAGFQLTLDANPDLDAEGGRVALGDIELDRLRVFSGDLSLNGDLRVAQGIDLSRADRVLVEADSTLRTLGGDFRLDSVRLDGPASLEIDLTGSGGAGSFVVSEGFGFGERLASLRITGDAFTLPGVRTTGEQIYTAPAGITLNGNLGSSETGIIRFDGPVTLLADRTIATAGGPSDHIEFLGTVLSPTFALTAQSVGGDSLFADAVDVRALAVNGSTLLRSADLQARQTVRLGGVASRDTVSLEGAGNSVRSLEGDVIVRGDIQGSSDLTVAVDASAAGDAIPVVRFEGAVGTETALDALTIGGGRSTVPEVATVVFGRFNAQGEPVAGQAFRVETTGDFTMGPFEKLTALGSISIDAGGTATIGDITAVGDLRVSSPDILIRTRPGAGLASVDTTTDPETLIPASALMDTGTDFVVAGTASFEGPIRLTDSSLNAPTLAEPLGQARFENIVTRAPERTLSLQDVVFNRRVGTGGGPAQDVTTVLDAIATGATTVPLASAVVDESVDQRQVGVLQSSLVRPTVQDAVGADAVAGVGLREPDASELRGAAARGVAITVDTPTALAGEGSIRISSARVSPEAAARIESAWNRVAFAVNEPANDRDAVYSRVRSLMGSAATRYRSATGASLRDVDPLSLFDAVRDASPDAGAAVERLADLVVAVRSAGLSEGETLRIERAIAEAIRPATMDPPTARSLLSSAVASR